MSTTANTISYTEHTGDGTTTSFEIGFPYTSQADVKVLVDNELIGSTDPNNASPYQMAWPSNTAISITKISDDTAVPLDGAIKIMRQTPIASPVTTFVDGSVMRSRDLNASNEQVLYAVQEVFDRDKDRLGKDGTGDFNAQDRKISSVADPTQPQDAVNQRFITSNLGAVKTVASIAGDVTTVAGIHAAVTNCSNDATDIGLVGGAIGNVNKVAGSIANVNKVGLNEDNVNLVAGSIGHVNTLAGINAHVTTVAGKDVEITALGIIPDAIQGCYLKRSEIEAVYGKLNKIENVEGKLTEVTAVGLDLLTPATSKIKKVADDITKVTGVADDIDDVKKLAAVDDEITALSQVTGNITTLGTDLAQGDASLIKLTADSITNINACAGIVEEITAVAADANDVSTIAGHAATITTQVSQFNTDYNDFNERVSAANGLLGNFGQNYLGLFPADPLIDDVAPDAFEQGMMYFNSDQHMMYVYSAGNGFVPSTSAPMALIDDFYFTATEGQTEFTGADGASNTLRYSPEALQVLVNGVRLPPTDFTATDGTSVTLITPAVLGDAVLITAFKPFQSTDMVPATRGGTFAGPVTFDGAVSCAGVTLNSLTINNVEAGNAGKALIVSDTAGAISYASIPTRVAELSDHSSYVKQDALTTAVANEVSTEIGKVSMAVSVDTSPSLSGTLDTNENMIKFGDFHIRENSSAIEFGTVADDVFTTLMQLDTAGNLTVKGNITAYDSGLGADDNEISNP